MPESESREPVGPAVVLSCVAEDRPDWFRKVQNLAVLSIRRTGGALADAPFVVNVVKSADPSLWNQLHDLDVDVRVVDPQVLAHSSGFNKLRMLELATSYEFDTLVMIDCDIVVLGDLSHYVAPTHLGMVPAILQRITPEAWTRVYTALDIPIPEQRVVATSTGERSFPYYNSGFMVVRREICDRLREAWLRLGAEIYRLDAAQPGFLGARVGDQVSLVCAIAQQGITLEQLPLHLNMSTRVRTFAPEYRDDWGPPFVLHYHGNIDAKGFLQASPIDAVTAELDRFNRLRADHLGVRHRRIKSPRSRWSRR